MRRIVLTFGLIAGAIMSAMMLLSMLFLEEIGYDRAEIIGYTTMVLAFLLVFVGVKSYRDNVAGGTISFGRAATVGALIVVVSAVCYTVTWQALYYWISPGVQTKVQDMMVDRAREKGGTPEAINERIAEAGRFAEMYKNPAVNVAFTFLEPLPVGLVVVLVTAGIVQRKRREDEPVFADALGAGN